MSQITIALDAGHGGSDSGAIYEGRREKDDTLRLVRAIGRILEDNGINVVYTRTTDEYETPFKKATDANNAGADYFVSIHRNSSEKDNQYGGVESLVYDDSGIKATMGRNINAQLAKAGFKNLGIDERPNLVVLKRTKMPAVLVEVGFINNDDDNATFDNNFNKIAQAIADGILETIQKDPKRVNKTEYEEKTNSELMDDQPDQQVYQNNTFEDDDRGPAYSYNAYSSNYSNYNIYGGYNDYNKQYDAYQDGEANIADSVQQSEEVSDANPLLSYPDEQDTTLVADAKAAESSVHMAEDPEEPLYRVQVGAYKVRDNADRMLNSLLMEGFPAFILNQDDYYKVQVGAYRYLTNAIKMERKLRRFHYNTYIVYS